MAAVEGRYNNLEGSSTAAARAAVNTARATKPAVAAIEATTTAAQAKSAGMKESFGDTTLGGIQQFRQQMERQRMQIGWRLSMAAVGMGERAASNKARERAVRGQNPLFQQLGAEGTANTTEVAAAATMFRGI